MKLHLQRLWSAAPALATVSVFASSCMMQGPASGTAVGNPGTTSIRTGPVQGMSWARAVLPVSTLTLTGCDGSTATVDVGQSLDLLGGDPLVLPEGSWCAMGLLADGPLVLEGSAASGASVNLALNVVSASFTGALPTDGSAVIVELGGPDWVTDAGYDPATGAAVDLAAGDPAEGRWTAALLRTSAVYADSDDNGSVSDDERAEGSVEERDDDDSSGDTGDTGTGAWGSDAEPGADAGRDTGEVSESGTGARTGADSKSDGSGLSDSAPDTDSSPDTGGGPPDDPGPKGDGGPGGETGGDTDPGGEPGSDADTGTPPASGHGGGSDSDRGSDTDSPPDEGHGP